MRGCQFLVHCAALYSFAPRDRSMMQRVNVAGTAGVLEAARIAGVQRAVVTSSGSTVGPAKNGLPATEKTHALNARGSAYHRSKLEQERSRPRSPSAGGADPTERSGGLQATRKPTPTGRLVLDFARGRIPARPEGGGLNLVAVEDVASAHVAALRHGTPRERYLIGGEHLVRSTLGAAL